MNPDPTSLDRLHDLAVPPPVPWWPPAPGWYGVLSLVLAGLMFFAFRAWRQWRANAWRRAALSELAAAPDATAIAEILRRSALSIAPRTEVVSAIGADWIEWLECHGKEPWPGAARAPLLTGVYGRAAIVSDLTALRGCAARWISTAS